MGVPLETGRTSVFDTEDGYRIARADYELPRSADRRGSGRRRPGPAALGVRAAGRRRAQRPGQAQGRRCRRRQLAHHPAPASPGRRRSPRSSPATPPPATAASSSSATSGRRGRPARRRVQPWGVVAWHGRWYLVGLDLDRGAERVFRLSRVVGPPKVTGPAGAFEPPAGLDLAEVVAGQVAGGAPRGRASPSRRRDRPLRRRAARARPTTATTGCSCARPSRAGWPTSSPSAPTSSSSRPRGPRRRRGPPDPAGRDGGARVSITGTSDRMTRLLALVPYLTARPRGPGHRGGARLRRRRAAAAQRPRAALDVRPARLRAR